MNHTAATLHGHRQLLASLADAHFICACDGKSLGPIENSESLCRLLERTGTCTAGLHLSQLVYPDDAQALEALLAQLDSEGHAAGTLCLVSRYNLPVPFTLTLLREQGAVFGAVRRCADDALQMRVALETSPDAIAVKDAQLRYRTINGQFCTLLGKEREDILGKTDADLFNERIAATCRREDLEVLATGKPLVKESKLSMASGERWMDVLLAPIPEREKPGESACGHMPGHGQSTARRNLGLVVTLREITERRRLEQRLRFAQFAFDHAALMIFWLDGDGRFLYVNDTAIRLLGYAREEFRAMAYCDIDPVCQELGRPNIWKKLSGQGNVDFETRFRGKTGHDFPVEIASDSLAFEGVEHHIVYARDISMRKRMEKLQRQSEESLRVIFDGVYDAILIHDDAGNILDVNEKMLDLYQVSRQEALASSIADDLSATDNPRGSLATLWTQALDGQPQFFEWKARRPGTGKTFDVEVYLRRIPLGGREVIMANIRDITERRKAEHERLLASKVYQGSLEGITITDHRARIISVNPAFTKITGYRPEEVLGRNPRVLKSHLHDKAFYKAMWRSLIQDGQWEGEIWNRRKNGEVYPEWLSISAVHDEQDRLQYYVAVFHDITEIKASQEKLKHQAYHDVLTGLPNRLLLKDRIATTLAHMARSGQKMALLFLDIDNFKHINDSLGHPVGDQLLIGVATRLRETMRNEDTVARLGGDEFVVMVEALESENLAIATAARLLEAFHAPFFVKGHELMITSSIGIALYPDDGEDPETLMKNADMAMYRAKEKGRNNFQLYTPALNERAVRRLSLERDLRKALELDEIQAWFQPRVSLRNGAILGAEALARWIKSDGTVIPPREFIPLAEETGLIIPLGEQILEKACRQAKAFQDAGHQEHYLSVNISPRQFRQQDLPGMVEGVLARTGLHSHLLEIEITEGSLMHDVRKAMSMLHILRDLGLSVAIDDFGTGYSSLAYLKHFPLGALKIDQSFIRGIPKDPSDIAITTTIISMAQSLDLKVVAEGVETPQQLHFIMGLRCDEYQGYLFSKPLPPDKYLEMLSKHST